MTDIAIIGGGASGLAAAVSAKDTCPSAKVVIAERLPRVGKKILSTGSGRCNLGNTDLSARHYHGSADAMSVISRTPAAGEFFGRMGVLTVSDSEGRLYPRSSSASTVLSALRLRTEQLGVRELCGFEVKSLTAVNGGWELRSAAGDTLRCRRAIIAAGGFADPKSGTDGSMLRLLKSMGVRTVDCTPAVAPLRVSPERLKGLKGVRVKGRVTARCGFTALASEEGEVQFTESAISGICVFNLAYLWAKFGKDLTISVDLAPDMDFRELENYLRSVRKLRPECPCEELLTGMFRRELAVWLIKNSLHRPMSDRLKNLSGSDLLRIADGIKDMSFPVENCAPWTNAQATCGGVHSSSFGKDMQLKNLPSIYICGEIADTVGDCGGYNLQWAWSSGILAGRCAADSLKGGGR